MKTNILQTVALSSLAIMAVNCTEKTSQNTIKQLVIDNTNINELKAFTDACKTNIKTSNNN